MGVGVTNLDRPPNPAMNRPEPTFAVLKPRLLNGMSIHCETPQLLTQQLSRAEFIIGTARHQTSGALCRVIISVLPLLQESKPWTPHNKLLAAV